MRMIGVGVSLLAFLLLLNIPVDGGDKKSGDKKSDGPKEAIATQLELIKAGNALELKNWFTERLRSQITPAAVKKAQKDVAKLTLDDLVADVKTSTVMGRDNAKIKMKSGRTLTTLIRIEGKWVADSLWFR